MKSFIRILAIAIIVSPVAPAFLVPHQFRGRRAVTIPPLRMPSRRASHSILAAKKSRQDEDIENLQNEIDAAIRQREQLRQELEEEIRNFSDRYESVNRNLQSADSRLEEETRSFQKQLMNEKKIIDGMEEVIVEKTQQLEAIKASGGFLQQAFTALNGLGGALAPVAALSVVALVGESVLRDRKRALEEERARIRRQRQAEAEARQQVSDAPLPGYAKASLAIGGIGLGLFVMTFLVGMDDSAVNTNTHNAATLGQEQQVTVVPKAGTQLSDEKPKIVEKSVEDVLRKKNGLVETRIVPEEPSKRKDASPTSLPESPSQVLATKDETITEKPTAVSAIPKKEELRMEEPKRIEAPPESKTESTLDALKQQVPPVNRAEEAIASKVKDLPKEAPEENAIAAKVKTPTIIKTEQLPETQPPQQARTEENRINLPEKRQTDVKRPTGAIQDDKVTVGKSVETQANTETKATMLPRETSKQEMEAPVVSKESKTQTEQAAKRQVNSPIVTSEEKVQKSQTPVIAKSRTDIEVKEEKPDAGNPTVSFTQKKDQVNSASEARMGGDNSKHKFSLVDSVNAPNVFGVTGSISKAVENAKSQDTPEISATVSNLLGGFPFKMVGAAIGGGLATAMLGNIFGRSKIKSEEESTQGAIDPQSGQAQQSVAASNRGNLVPGLLGKMFGRSKDDFEESSPQSPETLAGNSLITTNKEPIADTSNDSPFNQAKVDTQNPVDTDSLGMEFGDSIHDSNEGLRKTDASSAPANNSGPAMFDQKPAVTDSLRAEFGVSLHYSKEELRKTDARSAPANTPGPAMFDKSLPDQSKVPDKEPAESKFDAFEQSISDTTTPEPPAEPSTPEAVWIDKPLPPSPAKGTVSNNSKPSPWLSNRSPWKSKTATSAPTVFGSTGSVPSTSTKGKTIIDAEWKKATSLEEGSTQQTAPPHEIGNTNDPATFDEKAETKVEASNSSSDAERTGANLESMASASSAPDESKAKAPYPSESKPKVPPTPANPVSSTSGPSRRSSTDSARTGSVSTGDNHHSSLEDNFPTTASEEKPETSVGAGMSYLDSMSAKTSAPDWSKAKAPKTPDSPPPPVALPSPQSASSDSSAKVPSASEKTSSTSASYLDSMSANTAAPDWSNAKAPLPPPPESSPESPTGVLSSNSDSLPKVAPSPIGTKTTSAVTGTGYLDSMNGSSVLDWSKAKALSPSESSSVPAPQMSSSSPLSIDPNSKPTTKADAPVTGAGKRDLDSMSASSAPPDWSSSKGTQTATGILAGPASPSPYPSTGEPSVPATSEASSPVSGLSSSGMAISTGTGYLDNMSASTSAPDWSTAKAPAPPTYLPPVPPLPISTIQADSAKSSYSDNVTIGTVTPDWSWSTGTTRTPAQTPTVTPAPTISRQKPPTGRPEYTEPIEIRLPNMGDTKAKIVKWYKKEGDFVEYKDLLCDIETEDFSFGVVNEDDVDGVMGEIAVPENSGLVSGNDLLCTLFHKELSGTDEFPVPPATDSDSNAFAGAFSSGLAGIEHSFDSRGGLRTDSTSRDSPETTSDDKGYLDNSSPTRNASDWSAAIDTMTTEVPPTLYSQPVASSQITRADQSILAPIPILVPPMGKSKAKVSRWYKKKGDFVEYSDLLCDIQTEEFTFGVAHEYDVDAIMGGIEVREDGDFIRYGDLLCTLIPLREQKLRIDEAGTNDSEATPYDPSIGSFTDTPDFSGFHALHGSGLDTMHENPNVMENSGTYGAQQASTSTPDWVQAKSTSAPGVPAQSSISASLTSPGRQSSFSMPMPIIMPQIGEMKANIIRWYKKEGDFVKYKDLLCDIETEDFTFGVVNEDNVSGIMGAIAVTKNSGAIGGGDLLCTLFHRKEDLPNIGKAEENPARAMDSTVPMSPPAEGMSVSPLTFGPVSPPWSSYGQNKNTGLESKKIPSGATSSAAFGLRSVPMVSPTRETSVGGACTSYLDSMSASGVPDRSTAKTSSPSENLLASPQSSAFEKDPSVGKTIKESNGPHGVDSTASYGLGLSETPQKEESKTPASTDMMSYLDSMNSNTPVIDWSKAGKVSMSSEDSSKQIGSPADFSTFGNGSVPKKHQKAKPKTSSAAGIGHGDASANTLAQDWSEAKSSSSLATNEESGGNASAAFGLGSNEHSGGDDSAASGLSSVQTKLPGGKSNASILSGAIYLESMASASSAPDESKAKAPYPSESKPKVPPTPADPVSSTSGPSRRSSIDNARTGSVSTGDNHHSSLEDNFPTTASEEKPETSVGAGMSYLDSMSAKTSAPDWSKAKAPKTPDSPLPPVALPSPQSASSDSSAKVPSASEKTSSTSASYLDSMSANTAAPDWSNAKTPTTPDNPPLSPPPVAPVSPESTPVAPVSPESTPEKTLSDENSTGRGYIEIMNANPADKEWSSAKAPSPSESLLVSPPRLSATGEGSPVSPSADVTPDDPLFKTVRAESKGEVPTQVDSMEQKGMSSNASTPMHSTNLEDRANETNPYDLSNSSSKSNFVDRFTTSKGNSTSTYSVNEGASDEHSKQKGDPSNTEAINLESEADEGCVAPSDSKGMTSASNPAENTGPKKSAFMTIERTKKEKLSADTKLKKLARDAPISAKRPTSEKKIVAKALPTGNRMKKDRRSPPKGNNGPTVIKSDVHAPAPHKSPAAPMKNNLDVKAGPTRKKAIANVHSSVGIDKSTAKKKSKGRNGPPEPNQTPLEKKVATDKVPEKNGPEEPKEMTSKGKHEQGNVHASFKSTPPPEKKLVPTTNYLEKPRQGKTGPPVKKSDNAVRTISLTPLEKRFALETMTNMGADMLADSRNDFDNPAPKKSVVPPDSDKIGSESKMPGESEVVAEEIQKKKAIDDSVAGTQSKSDSVTDSSTTSLEEVSGGVMSSDRNGPEKSNSVSKSPNKLLPKNEDSHAILDDIVVKSIKAYVKKEAGLISVIALEALVESVKDYVLKQARFTAPIVLDDTWMDSIKAYVKQARSAESAAAIDKPTNAYPSTTPESWPPLEKKSITEPSQEIERPSSDVNRERLNETRSSPPANETVGKINASDPNFGNPACASPDSMTPLEKRYRAEQGPEISRVQPYTVPVAPNDTLDRISPPNRYQSMHDVNKRGSIPHNSMTPDSRPKRRPMNPFATRPIAPNAILGRPPVRQKSLTPLERRYSPGPDLRHPPVTPDIIPVSYGNQNTDPPKRSLTPLEQRHNPNSQSSKRLPNPFTVVPPAPDDVRPFSDQEKPVAAKSLTPLERRYRSANPHVDRSKTSGWIPPLADRHSKAVTGNTKSMPGTSNMDRTKSSDRTPPLSNGETTGVAENATNTPAKPNNNNMSKSSVWIPPLADRHPRDVLGTTKNWPESRLPRDHTDKRNKRARPKETRENSSDSYAWNTLDETEPFS